MEPDEGRRKDLAEQAVRSRYEWLGMASDVEKLEAEIASLENNLDDKLRKALLSVPPNTDFEKVKFGRSELTEAVPTVRSLAEAKAHLEKLQARMLGMRIDEEFKARRGQKKAAYEEALKELVAILANRPPGDPGR
jgi:hypothetical protein